MVWESHIAIPASFVPEVGADGENIVNTVGRFILPFLKSDCRMYHGSNFLFRKPSNEVFASAATSSFVVFLLFSLARKHDEKCGEAAARRAAKMK